MLRKKDEATLGDWLGCAIDSIRLGFGLRVEEEASRDDLDV